MRTPCQAFGRPGSRAGRTSRGARHIPRPASVNARYNQRRSKFRLMNAVFDVGAEPSSAGARDCAGAVDVPPVKPLGAAAPAAGVIDEVRVPPTEPPSEPLAELRLRANARLETVARL